MPNGHRMDLELIEHPGAVLVVPFLKSDSVIMLRQLRPVINKYIYELPAGTKEPGERESACVSREIVEETGYSAGKLTRLGFIYPVPGYSTEKITVYRADGLKKAKRDPQADEIISVRIIGRKQLKAMFGCGRIVDAKTICAFTLCGWL